MSDLVGASFMAGKNSSATGLTPFALFQATDVTELATFIIFDNDLLFLSLFQTNWVAQVFEDNVIIYRNRLVKFILLLTDMDIEEY